MLYLIINETSRTGKAAEVWKELQQDIMNLEIPYKMFKTEYPGHATKLAQEICSYQDDDRCIVTLGGDGTMNEVINGITDFDDTRFGIVPLGSGNDFGRGLDVTSDWRKNLQNIVKHIKGGRDIYSPVDLGLVKWGNGNQRLFGISSGIGMDAIVTKKVNGSFLKKALNKLHIGKISYSLMTIYTLFSMKTYEMKVEYETNDEKLQTDNYKKTIFSSFMNLRAEGGGVPMSPEARGDNGVLTMCCAAEIPKAKTFLCLPILLAAKHEKVKGFSLSMVKKANVELSCPVTLHADGEYLGEVKHAEFSCLAGKLRMLN